MYDDVMVSYLGVSVFQSLEVAVLLANVWIVILGLKNFWILSLEDLLIMSIYYSMLRDL